MRHIQQLYCHKQHNLNILIIITQKDIKQISISVVCIKYPEHIKNIVIYSYSDNIQLMNKNISSIEEKFCIQRIFFINDLFLYLQSRVFKFDFVTLQRKKARLLYTKIQQQMPSLKRQTIYLGLFALIVMSTNSSFSTLVAFIHKQEQHFDRGSILLMITSIFFLLSNFFTPFLTSHPKQLLELSTTGMMLNYILNFLFTNTQLQYPFVILGAIVGGLSYGVFSVSLNSYLNIMIQARSMQNQSGYYFGVNGMITNGCLLVGGTFSLITSGGQASNFYYIYLFLMLLAAWTFSRFYLRDHSSQKQPIKYKSWLKDDFSLSKLLSSVKSAYIKIYPLIWVQIIYGFMNGLLSQCVVDLVPQEYAQQKGKKLAQAIILMGCGAMIGSYISGKVSDKVGMRKLGCFLLMFYLLMVLVIWLGISWKSLGLLYLSSFLIGGCLLSLFSWLLICCSKLYGGSVQVFSANRQICNLSFVLYQCLAIAFFKSTSMSVIMNFQLGLFTIFGLLALFMLKILPKSNYLQKQQQQSKQQNIVLTLSSKTNQTDKKIGQNQQEPTI